MIEWRKLYLESSRASPPSRSEFVVAMVAEEEAVLQRAKSEFVVAVVAADEEAFLQGAKSEFVVVVTAAAEEEAVLKRRTAIEKKMRLRRPNCSYWWK